MSIINDVLNAAAGIAQPYVAIAAAAGVTQLVRLLTHLIGRIKSERLQAAAAAAVLSVEQQFSKTLSNPDKKKIAVDRVKKLVPFVPDSIISAFVEAAVLQLGQATGTTVMATDGPAVMSTTTGGPSVGP